MEIVGYFTPCGPIVSDFEIFFDFFPLLSRLLFFYLKKKKERKKERKREREREREKNLFEKLLMERPIKDGVLVHVSVSFHSLIGSFEFIRVDWISTVWLPPSITCFHPPIPAGHSVISINSR